MARNASQAIAPAPIDAQDRPQNDAQSDDYLALRRQMEQMRLQLENIIAGTTQAALPLQLGPDVTAPPAPFNDVQIVSQQDMTNPRSAAAEQTDLSSVVYIGVVGVTGSGKSTLIQRITGCDNLVVADGLQSGTREVEKASLQLEMTKVVLVDTPGFNDSEMEDEDVYYLLADWIKETHRRGRRFSGLLYLHPMNRTREKGSDVRSLNVFKRLVGDANFRNVVIGMTFCDVEKPDVVASREAELRADPEFWASMIAGGATVVRIPVEKEKCIELIAELAQRSTITLQAEKEMCEDNKPAAETSAMQAMPHREKLEALRLEEERERLIQERIQEERSKLTSEFAQERLALEEEILEQQKAKQLLEEELLTWQTVCQQQKDECRSIELQYKLEEEFRKQKAEQDRKSDEAKRLRAQMEEEDKLREERLDREYAERQVKKHLTYMQSQVAVLNKYITTFTENGGPAWGQGLRIIEINTGGTVVLGLRCQVCWTVLGMKAGCCGECPFPARESIMDERPDKRQFLTMTAFKYDMPERLQVCSTEACYQAARNLLPKDTWKATWHYPLTAADKACEAKEYSRIWCNGCRKDITGFYMHCCGCSCQYDLCLRCWGVEGKKCHDPDEHALLIAYFDGKDIRYDMRRRPAS